MYSKAKNLGGVYLKASFECEQPSSGKVGVYIKYWNVEVDSLNTTNSNYLTKEPKLKNQIMKMGTNNLEY